VVAKAILEVVRNESAQGIALVLTLLLEHIWASEDVTIELLTLDDAKFALLGIY
jgi:hypothetical protein